MSNSWEKPNTNCARSQIFEYQLNGTRRLANTLLLTVSGTNEGPDPKPTTVSRQTLLLQAKTICGGHTEHQADEQRKKGYRLPGQCANNTRTSRDAAMEHEYGSTAANAPAARWSGTERSHQASAHPCQVCVCQWLLQHNGLKVRLARELNQTNSTDRQHPEATVRIEGMTVTLLSAPGVEDAAIPAERPIVPAAIRRAAGLPKHQRPNNAVELRVKRKIN
jgi:hypothetical protein